MTKQTPAFPPDMLDHISTSKADIDRRQRLADLDALEADMRARPGDHTDLLRIVRVLKNMNR